MAFRTPISQATSVKDCTCKSFSTGKPRAGNKPSVLKSNYPAPSWFNRSVSSNFREQLNYFALHVVHWENAVSS